MLGRELGWKIDDDSTVTKVSAFMVNEEKIGIYQEAGKKNWWGELPKNVKIYQSLEEMQNSDSKGYLIISDRILDGSFLKNSVVYRPPRLGGRNWITLGYYSGNNKRRIEFLLTKIQTQ